MTKLTRPAADMSSEETAAQAEGAHGHARRIEIMTAVIVVNGLLGWLVGGAALIVALTRSCP